MPENQLIILHTNDLHNHKAPLEWLAENPRENNTLLLDAGDAIAGSNILFFPREEILELMHNLGYQAMAVGNREFQYLRTVFKQRLASAGFPLLSANLLDLKGEFQALLKPAILLKKAGLKIGILGLTPVQYKENSLGEKLSGFRFLDPLAALEKNLASWEEQPDLIILLSHLGVAQDKQVAERFPEIGVIIGGHDHLGLKNPLPINRSLILQTESHGKFLGKLTLEISPAGKGVNFKLKEYQLIKTGS